MNLIDDLKVLYCLTIAPRRGDTHAERMERFYKGQASAYDGFRERLLKGRREMLFSLPWEALEEAVWVDLGAGTGANAEFVASAVGRLKALYQVDLSPSLLAVARARIERNEWPNVRAVEADATTFSPPEWPVDLVTFSYSLTMIPDWMAAVDHAFELLRPGGLIGVVDFHVSRKYEPSGRRRHGWMTRTFWPAWFAFDNVFLSAEHVHYLHRKFEPVTFEEAAARLPYWPTGRVPYYRFIGRKR